MIFSPTKYFILSLLVISQEIAKIVSKKKKTSICDKGKTEVVWR